MYNTRKQKKNTPRKTVMEVFSIFLKTPHLLFRLVTRCNALVKCKSLNNIYTLKESNLKLFFSFFRILYRFFIALIFINIRWIISMSRVYYWQQIFNRSLHARKNKKIIDKLHVYLKKNFKVLLKRLVSTHQCTF